MMVFCVGGILIAACVGCVGVARRVTNPQDPMGLGLMLIAVFLAFTVGVAVMQLGAKL